MKQIPNGYPPVTWKRSEREQGELAPRSEHAHAVQIGRLTRRPAMLHRASVLLITLFTTAQLPLASAAAQDSGRITGVVRESTRGAVAGGVRVSAAGSVAVTAADGRYTLSRVPAGEQAVEFRAIGYAPTTRAVIVPAGQSVTLDVTLEVLAVRLSDVVVAAPSRSLERIVEAPAAVTVIPAEVLSAAAPLGQAPMALVTVPGVDIVQNGVNDFNVNARGFNSSLTRRVLVLLDGRDPAIAFLGSQEWAALGISLEDVSRIEMVRGPGSALYGANAFSGVLSVASMTAREAAGSRLTVSAGELDSRRADVRHARVLGSSRFGYKLAAGYGTSDTWTRSRTRLDSTDIVREYAGVTDSAVVRYREVRALNGQQLDPGTLEAIGERDPVTNAYGSARFDYYGRGGGVGSVEAGIADTRNETFVTGLGRVQVTHAQRPWARGAWGTERFNVLAWYTGRDTRDPQWSLASGNFLLEKSAVLHGEVQYNAHLPRDRGRWIAGASARSTHMNTHLSLMRPEDDDRDDRLYSAYGQLELHLAPRLKLVTAARLDDGTLLDLQLSPKAALVFAPDANRSLRLSVNRAFQTPNFAEFFLHAQAAPPTEAPRALELALESFLATGRAIGTEGLPSDLPWNFPAQTKALGLGNRALDVEKVMGYELGYQGTLTARGYFTLDLFWNEKRDFVTDLLPNVNPAYPQYLYGDGGTDVPAYLAAIAARAASLPEGAISEMQRQQIIAGAAVLRANYDALVARTQPLLTTVDGERALVVSYTNAGRVTERGFETSATLQLLAQLRAEASYAFFDFTVREPSVGTDALLPNTPKHKGAIALVYGGSTLDAGVTVRLASGYPWAAGVFSGYVPAAQTVNANVTYRALGNLKPFLTGTNVFNQRHFEIYGGSVVGRRVIGGVTATF